MRYLVDTHVPLWWLTGDARLSAATKEILDNESDIYLSPVSLWEITIKQRAGKLAGPHNLAELARERE